MKVKSNRSIFQKFSLNDSELVFDFGKLLKSNEQKIRHKCKKERYTAHISDCCISYDDKYAIIVDHAGHIIVLDFKDEEDLNVANKLIKKSDVLIENFKVGGLKKYKLDYASVSKLNPKLIYCSITGFGQTGPYAHRAGYDYIIQGMSGLMSITGEPSGQPQKMGVAVTDILTGLYSVTAILSAIIQRDKTGKGQHIDMALLDVATAVTANQGMNFLTTGKVPHRIGNGHQNLAPCLLYTSPSPRD